MASDRGSATELAPGRARARRGSTATGFTSPGYALLREPVAAAAIAAVELARAGGATVSIDLSAWSLIDEPFRERVRRCAPETRLRDRARAGRRSGRSTPPGWSSAARWALTWPAWITRAFPTEVVDPTGAGDAFAAGFLVGGVRARPRGGGALLREARSDAVIRIADEVAEALARRPRRRRARDDARRARLPAGRGRRGRARLRARGARGRRRCRRRSASSTARSSSGSREDELARFDASARKVGPRDLAAAVVQGAVGATTVGGTLVACRAAGIRFMATGGLGGVHRGWPDPPDVSADLDALARTPALVVSSGVKSLLDVPATAELLETLGVPVLGWRTDDLPLFYAAHGGPPVSTRVEDAAEAARHRARALGARRRRPPARPAARREPRRRRAADRARRSPTRRRPASAAAR